jgi:hypothetical protein
MGPPGVPRLPYLTDHQDPVMISWIQFGEYRIPRRQAKEEV